MPATRDGKTWRSQFYYEDWQGVRVYFGDIEPSARRFRTTITDE